MLLMRACHVIIATDLLLATRWSNGYGSAKPDMLQNSISHAIGAFEALMSRSSTSEAV